MPTKSWNSWGEAELSKPDNLKDTDRVIVRYRDGIESKVRVVGDLRWSHEGLPDDIIAWHFSHHGNGE